MKQRETEAVRAVSHSPFLRPLPSSLYLSASLCICFQYDVQGFEEKVHEFYLSVSGSSYFQDFLIFKNLAFFTHSYLPCYLGHVWWVSFFLSLRIVIILILNPFHVTVTFSFPWD